jgi:hypothetical protein
LSKRKSASGIRVRARIVGNADSQSSREMRTLQHVLDQRDDLLADKDSVQPNQGHHGRRWRSHVEQAVDDADQETGAEGQNLDAHLGHPAEARHAACRPAANSFTASVVSGLPPMPHSPLLTS